MLVMASFFVLPSCCFFEMDVHQECSTSSSWSAETPEEKMKYVLRDVKSATM